MKARELIDDATYDADQIKIIGKAFDDAWAQIAPDVGQYPQAIEAARLKLATVVLSAARHGFRSPEHLKEAALKLMFADPTQL